MIEPFHVTTTADTVKEIRGNGSHRPDAGSTYSTHGMVRHTRSRKGFATLRTEKRHMSIPLPAPVLGKKRGKDYTIPALDTINFWKRSACLFIYAGALAGSILNDATTSEINVRWKTSLRTMMDEIPR